MVGLVSVRCAMHQIVFFVLKFLSSKLKDFPLFRNMVLQNESVDEDLEHFEDIVEETDTGPTCASKKEENSADVHGGEGANSDSNCSEDEDVLPTNYSDDDGSDDADELFIRESPNDPQKPKMISNQKVLKPQVSSTQSFLPGGYNPRHREPSYRYVSCHRFLTSGVLYSCTAYI